MPTSRLSILLVCWLCLQAQAAPPPGPRVRLVWKGVQGAVSYEVQTAEDEKFTKGLRRLPLRSATELLPLNELPAHARARPVFAGRRSGRWIRLSKAAWKAPELPDTLKVPKDEAGSVDVRWSNPADARDRELTYRVRVIADAGMALYDALVERNSFRLPRLPGGDYLVTVEAVGDARLGTLHREGDSIAHARIEAEAIE
jgi:hypothetical protein